MLDLLHELEGGMSEGWEAASKAELKSAEQTRRSISRFTRAMAIAALLLLFFNSGQLVTYVNGFEVGPVQDAVVALSTTWNEQMEKNHLNEPFQTVRDFMSRLRATSWQEVGAHVDAAQHSDSARLLRGMLYDETSGARS